MRASVAILVIILASTLIAGPVATASDRAEITSAADAIAPLSADQIANALQTPAGNAELPTGFSDAAFVKQDEAGMHTRDAGATKSVTYTMTYTPGNPSASGTEASPRASGPAQLYNTASITYLIFEADLSPEMLGKLGDILRASIGDQAADAEVRDVTISEQPARLITIETETNGVPIIIDWVAVPVGKVVVISMTMSGGSSVNRDVLVADAEALSTAAIAHLGTVAEQRGTPAG